MSILATFTVPAADFLLERSLERVPEMHVEVERVAVEDEAVTPYLWAGDGDFEAFEAALADDPSVEDARPLETDPDRRLYRITWRRRVEDVTYAISDTDATVLKAESEGENWTVQILFPDEDTLSAFQDYAAAHDLSLHLDRLHRSDYPEAVGKYGLTDEQVEALVTAYETGYFEVPGEVTLDAVAAELGISKNAASARLRRGYCNLVQSTLTPEADRV